MVRPTLSCSAERAKPSWAPGTPQYVTCYKYSYDFSLVCSFLPWAVVVAGKREELSFFPRETRTETWDSPLTYRPQAPLSISMGKTRILSRMTKVAIVVFQQHGCHMHRSYAGGAPKGYEWLTPCWDAWFSLCHSATTFGCLQTSADTTVSLLICSSLHSVYSQLVQVINHFKMKVEILTLSRDQELGA